MIWLLGEIWNWLKKKQNWRTNYANGIFWTGKIVVTPKFGGHAGGGGRRDQAPRPVDLWCQGKELHPHRGLRAGLQRTNWLILALQAFWVRSSAWNTCVSLFYRKYKYFKTELANGPSNLAFLIFRSGIRIARHSCAVFRMLVRFNGSELRVWIAPSSLASWLRMCIDRHSWHVREDGMSVINVEFLARFVNSSPTG